MKVLSMHCMPIMLDTNHLFNLFTVPALHIVQQSILYPVAFACIVLGCYMIRDVAIRAGYWLISVVNKRQLITD